MRIEAVSNYDYGFCLRGNKWKPAFHRPPRWQILDFTEFHWKPSSFHWTVLFGSENRNYNEFPLNCILWLRKSNDKHFNTFTVTFLKPWKGSWNSYGEACLFHLLVVVVLVFNQVRRATSTERIELKFSLEIALVPMSGKQAAQLDSSRRCCAVPENLPRISRFSQSNLDNWDFAQWNTSIRPLWPGTAQCPMFCLWWNLDKWDLAYGLSLHTGVGLLGL